MCHRMRRPKTAPDDSVPHDFLYGANLRREDVEFAGVVTLIAIFIGETEVARDALGGYVG